MTASSEMSVPKGYQKLARLMGSHQEVAIFRRFDSLTIWGLLSLQAEILDLEIQLQKAWEANLISPEKPNSEFWRDFYTLRESAECKGGGFIQHDLLKRCRECLQIYHGLLLQASGMAQMSDPTPKNLRILKKWLRNKAEGGFFLQGDERYTWGDLDSPLDGKTEEFVVLRNPQEDQESLAKWVKPWLISWYNKALGGRMKHKQMMDPENPKTIDYKESRAVQSTDVVVILIATIFASITPALAILWLNSVSHTATRIWITVGLTTGLGIVLKYLTNANMREIFGATAAFAAVEVVFIGSANGTAG